MAFLVPIEVDGMTAALSHLDGVEIQIESGREVTLSLTNFTGTLLMSPTQGTSSRKDVAIEKSARGAKRRGESLREDPAAVKTVKKQKGGQDKEEESDAGRSDDDNDNDEPACLSHVYAEIDAAAGEELTVNGGAETDKGVFAFLGNGKNPSKTGAVVVSASGYDPGLRRPEDIISGRKSGDGCMALPTGDARGTSPQHKEVCFFEFELKGGLEMKPTRYTLRNGSRDYGTYLKNWVLQQYDEDGSWVTIARADDDQRLDGNRQMLCSFDVASDHGFSSRFRIRSSIAHHDRHPLWLLAVEFFGVLRRRRVGQISLLSANTKTSPSQSSFQEEVETEKGNVGMAQGAGMLSLTTIPSSVSCSPVVSPAKSRVKGADNANLDGAPPSKQADAGAKPAGSAGASRGGGGSAGKPKIADAGVAGGAGSRSASKAANKQPPTKGIASFFQKKA